MLGLMQDYPLLTQTIPDQGALNSRGRELVTRSVEGRIRRSNLAHLRRQFRDFRFSD